MPYTTINKGSSYFNTKLYTGTGATNSVTGVGFQPDLTWIKNRNGTDWNRLIDAVRGATKEIYSNADAVESTQAQSLQSFNTDGFTLGTLAEVNRNGYPFVSWNWLANNTSGSTNTAGTITSTVAANTTAGFSIVSWTGTTGVATVGHGLGTTPAMIIVKNRSVVASWVVYHQSLGATKYLFLNLSLGPQTDSLAWNNTQPDSTKFTINSYTNGSGNSLIAYCFSEIKGYSKFGSYTGNGNADGTFVYTGFKPAFVMFKYSGPSEGWAIFDDVRNTYNPESLYLYANLANVEGTETGGVDFLSNGFKIRNSFGYTNNSGGTYVYMAFAENPFKNANAR